MIYNKPYLILFGGYNWKRELNNIFINKFDKIEKNSIIVFNIILWRELDIKDNVPSPRMYFPISLCEYGDSQNMIFI